MPISRRDPYRPRKCRLCKLTFKPTDKNPANAAGQEFCCPGHRKDFWKHGALPFDKLMAKIEKRVRQIVRDELKSIAPPVPPTEEVHCSCATCTRNRVLVGLETDAESRAANARTWLRARFDHG